MSLQDIIAKYKITDEDVDEINTHVQAEKQVEIDKGIAASKKKNQEAIAAKQDRDKIRDLVKATLELDLDSDLETQLKAVKEKIKTPPAPGAGGDAVELMKKDFAKQLAAAVGPLQKQLDDEKAAKIAVDTKYRNSTISAKLSKRFDGVLSDKDLAIENLIMKGLVKLNESGDDVIFIDGDEELDAEKGVDLFKKSHPGMVINNQNPGSGGGVLKTTKTGKGKETMKRADWDNLQKSDPKAAASFALTGDIQD